MRLLVLAVMMLFVPLALQAQEVKEIYECNPIDPEGDDLTFEWTILPPGPVFEFIDAGGVPSAGETGSLIITFDATTLGSYMLICEVSDGEFTIPSGDTPFEIVVVLGNRPPDVPQIIGADMVVVPPPIGQ